LGLFFFPFSLFNLQVHKPASADLLIMQFKGELRAIHPDFLSQSFVTGTWVFHPTNAHRVRMRIYNGFSLRACAFGFNSARAFALCAPVYALQAVHLIKISHCKDLGCGESHFPS
jgi:hypothetical protein